MASARRDPRHASAPTAVPRSQEPLHARPPVRHPFEPVKIGPVTARNRFYQVPHCNGMGYRDPSGEAHMRRVKAEGGWAVVCTEQVEIHPPPTSALHRTAALGRPGHADAHAYLGEDPRGRRAGRYRAGAQRTELTEPDQPGSPAGTAEPAGRVVELRPGPGPRNGPRPTSRTCGAGIARRRRSLQAEYDIVYVYAGHALGGLHHFLSRRYNNRTDEYGGSIENRARLLREILEDTEVCDGKAAVACRISVDELLGDDGHHRAEIEDVIGMLGEHPDLWDFVAGQLGGRLGHVALRTRGRTGALRSRAQALTTKPVVGVGRFTSPDMMVRQVKTGVLDLIGAARPSIADPFLPTRSRRQPRGHPRMHRLQHLRLRRLHHVAHPLHPEPDHGRGMAPRLASREDPAESPATPRC